VIGTKGQKARLQIAATEGPKLLTMIEQYTAIPFPFEKLDLLGTPILGGAMENAGLIIQDDTLMLLDANAPLSQLRAFAEVTAHEMAHQWFGDLVTPSWWTDIWLNESFAEWMGKKIGNQWRPDLGIAASELEEAFSAMDTDSLGKGRPIRQPITHNRQVASAFDEITYQKGGQVLSMFESYLGTEKFAAGVHKHLERYKNANATADDFFRSLSEAAGDPKIVPAMRTFTDQTGVPIIAVSQSDKGLTLTQTRYRPLGIAAKPAQTWKIPFCMSAGQTHSCSMLEAASTTIPAPASKAPLMPNAGGAGYYRFHLDPESANRLIAEAAKLPAREALALADSLWSDFAAGTGSFEQVVAAARALSGHPQRLAALELAGRMAELANSALTPEQVQQYRKVMQAIYAPRLAALGFDLKAGAYKNDPAEKQSLRTSLVSIVGLEARSPDVRAKLVAAADAFINGDSQALDPAFRPAALAAAVQERGAPFMTKLRDMMVKSDDPLLRRNAAQAIATADTPATAAKAFDLAMGPGMQAMETLQIVLRNSVMPGAHDTVVGLVDKNFDKVMDTFPGFSRPAVLRIFSGECAANSVAKVDAFVNPKLKTIGGGELELAQTKERIGQCVALKQAKSAEISAVLAKAAT
jgi:aminopeptidase N